MRIAYLIPEFPGQTHIFFWRERAALSKIGVSTYRLERRYLLLGASDLRRGDRHQSHQNTVLPLRVRQANHFPSAMILVCVEMERSGEGDKRCKLKLYVPFVSNSGHK